MEKQLLWLKLDNAAKIYPAARRRKWSNLFRLSVTLTEPVDPWALERALERVVRRFPSIAVRLRRGMFWYYLEQLPQAPRLQEEKSYPLTLMPFREVRRCAFRVLYYKKRIAVEFFHSLTDGNGGLIFLKTLTAEYLKEKYGADIPAEMGVLDCGEEPRPEELEDLFPKYSAPAALSRQEASAYRMWGSGEKDGFRHITQGTMPVDKVKEVARQYGGTVTEFLAAVMLQAVMTIQAREVPRVEKRKPVKISLPINLRSVFGGRTLRNFMYFTNVGVEAKLGEYTLQQLVNTVHHQLALAVTPQNMAGQIAANVKAEQSLLLRLAPLFVKNFAMKLVYDQVGETKNCLNISNLGLVKLPEEMGPFVEHMDFILSPQATYPNNCGVIACGNKLRVNMIRNIREPELERLFFTTLVELGIPVEIESNQR